MARIYLEGQLSRTILDYRKSDPKFWARRSGKFTKITSKNHIPPLKRFETCTFSGSELSSSLEMKMIQPRYNDLASADAAPGLVSFWISNLQFSLVHTTSNQCFAIAMKFSTFGQYHIRSNINKSKPIWRNFLCTSNSNLVYPIIDGVAKLWSILWFSVKTPLLGSTQK